MNVSSKSKSSTKKSSKKEKKEKEHQRKKSDATEAIAELVPDIKKDVGKFLTEDLSRLIDKFLLEYNSFDVRSQARRFIQGICFLKVTLMLIIGLWVHANHEQQNFVYELLASKFPVTPSFGRNGTQFVELATFIINSLTKKSGTQQGLNEFIANIMTTFRQQNDLISNHPNSHVYNTLQGFVDFDGYYLDSQPCLVCNDPGLCFYVALNKEELPWYQLRMDALKSEQKFTDSTHVVKFVASYMINGITLRIQDNKKAKMIKQVNFYYNNKPVTDVSELKNKWSAWKKAKSCILSAGNEV